MPQVNEQQVYDELVGLCYECVLDDSAWLPLLERLIAASGHQQGLLLFADYRKYGAQASTTLNLCDPAVIDAYNRHYCHLDPSFNLVHSRSVGYWSNDRIDIGPERIRRDPYYQEFCIPFGLHNLSCIKLEQQADSDIYLTVLNELGAPLPTAQQYGLLQRVSPHLLKAAKLSNKVNRLELELAKRDLLLDHHPTPLWLLDGDGHVLHCNQAAARCMSQSGFPFYEHFTRLHSKSQDTSLQALIHHAAGKDGKRRAGRLCLNTSQQQELLVTPVPAESAFNQSLQKPLVLLALLGNQPQSPLLAELFQLSPAEQRLAELLAQSFTPEGCAQRLKVSINTVRSQLRALFRKTDTTRQAELVNLFARLRS
jgi:DNA-binding CsgD family transcriptional regulator/PAS domain-containing protein